MAATLFIPFEHNHSAQLRGMAQTWVNRVTADARQKAVPAVAVYDPLARVLAAHDPQDSIYVLSHGGGNPNWIYNDVGLVGVPVLGINETELVKRLVRSGLQSDQHQIKLYICNINNTMRPFAERVRQLLSGRAPNVIVSYYMGSVSVPVDTGGHIYHKFSTVGLHQPGPAGFALVHDNGGIIPSRAMAMRVNA